MVTYLTPPYPPPPLVYMYDPLTIVVLLILLQLNDNTIFYKYGAIQIIRDTLGGRGAI
jgi:hypothetical protein